MSMKEKIGYIIEYYGFMILALLVMILVGIFMISGLFEEEKVEGISVVAVNQEYTEDTIRIMKSSFAEAYGTIPVEFEPFLKINLEGYATDLEQGYLMKLSANLFAGEIDVMILDTKSYHHFSDLGALTELRPELLEILSDLGYDDISTSFLISAESEYKVETFGIELPDFAKQDSEAGSYLVIPKSSRQKDGYPELIRTLYDSERK